jgi:4'-phosphopantetheinyl transferase
LLSPTEAATAQRLGNLQQLRFKNRRAALRLLLGRHLQQSPTSIQYVVGDNGKPYLENSCLRFNVSHSGDMAAIALGFDCEIGIDIERLNVLSNSADIAADFFTEAERRDIASLSIPMRERAILTMWTRKESILKADGIGIRNGVLVPVPSYGSLHSFEVMQEIDGTKRCFYLYDIDVDPDYIVSLAISNPYRVITQTMYD